VRPLARAQPPRPRLLVLPFLNLSGDPAEDYFSDAMTDEVITALANLAPGELAVIARTTAMHYKGSHKDIARIARELRVDYVLEASMRHNQEQVSINAQLIQASDQTHLFARKFESGTSDVFELQNCIARILYTHIPGMAGRSRSGEAEGGTSQKPSNDVAA